MEKFKDVVGYEGYYEVGDMGTVKSVGRLVRDKNGGRVRNIKGRVLKPAISGSGYLTVSLHKGYKQTSKTVHSLVVKSFINSIFEVVNHVDSNKLNNSVKNLEATTYSKNLLHAIRTCNNTLKKNMLPEGSIPLIINMNYYSKMMNPTGLSTGFCFPNRWIARCFNVSPRYIARIIKGEVV